MRRGALLAVCLVACLPALAQDPLSGGYRPLGEPVQPDDPAPLQVQARDTGWMAYFQGEGLALARVDAQTLSRAFPFVGEGAGLVCGAADDFMLCRVAPGTVFPRDGFRAQTGYFSILRDAGLFELERVSP